MWVPLTYFFVACQADEVDSLLQRQQLSEPDCFTREAWTPKKTEWCCANKNLGCKLGCNREELFGLVAALPDITRVLNAVKEFSEDFTEWPPQITFVKAITENIGYKSKTLKDDADKCAEILHKPETDHIQRIIAEVDDLLMYAMKTYGVAHPTPVVPIACLKGKSQKIDLTATPRSMVAWIRVPKHFGNERVGVIAGSFEATYAINWEIHEKGKPRLWWGDYPISDWRVDLDMRDGLLHQVAWVVNSAGTQALFYVDGIPRGKHNDKYSGILPRGPTYYGRDYRASVAFKGDLYDVVISDKELSRSQLSTIGQKHCS